MVTHTRKGKCQMEYLMGNVVMSYGVAQLLWLAVPIILATCSFIFIYHFGMFISGKDGYLKKHLIYMLASFAVVYVLVATWSSYENTFFKCEKVVAIENESSYGCYMRKTKDGEWSLGSSVTLGSKPYQKYDLSLYKFK